VNKLETNRDKIIQGMRDGARRVFDIFAERLGIPISLHEECINCMFPLN
jgi:hypothetical protein